MDRIDLTGIVEDGLERVLGVEGFHVPYGIFHGFIDAEHTVILKRQNHCEPASNPVSKESHHCARNGQVATLLPDERAVWREYEVGCQWHKGAPTAVIN